MPRASSITADLLAEVARRRRQGEAWKVILRDLRRRGLPAGRTTWARLIPDVPEHLGAGQDTESACTPA